jgi:hypothetical protein
MPGYDRRVFLAPPITIRCECGNTQAVKYGERWMCPGCARTYDTTQIPESEYRERMTIVREYRLVTMGPLVVLAAIMVPLVVFVDADLIFFMGLLAFAYILVFMPIVRRRMRRRVREGPAWDLKADESGLTS